MIDPNKAGAIITESAHSTTVAENGLSNDTYEIKLTQRPTSNVTVTFIGGNGQVEGFDANNPANKFVVFTPQNWNTSSDRLGQGGE